MIKFYITLLLFSSVTFAQEHHFKAERKEVTWKAEFKQMKLIF